MARWTHANPLTEEQRMEIAWRMREEQQPPATFREIAHVFGLKSLEGARWAYVRAKLMKRRQADGD